MAESRHRWSPRRRRRAAAPVTRQGETDRNRFFSVRLDGPAATLELDAFGRVVAADPAALALFGSVSFGPVDASALLGRSVIELLPPPAGVRPIDHLTTLLGAHSPVTGFGRLPAQAWDACAVDGHPFLVDATLSRVDTGRAWHYHAILHAVAARSESGPDTEATPAIDLREPLGDDRVVLRYRPMFDLVTGHVVSVEAQAHLLCDDGSLIAPDAFTSLWERTGLLGRLAEIVIPQALRDVMALRADPGAERVQVSVDISPDELTPAFVEMMYATTVRHELAASALQIEITEQAPLDAMPDVVAQLRSLHAFGVGVVLDDFGSGFARLDLIRDLPVDAVKIDRRFVQRMIESTLDRDIVETIIGVAQRRELTVLADGVATVEQAHALVRLGCRQAQGPLFGPPVDIDELRYRLREWRAVPAIATAMVKNR